MSLPAFDGESRELWLVAGPVASGKTTACTRLYKAYGAAHWCEDVAYNAAYKQLGYKWWDWTKRIQPENAREEIRIVDELYTRPLERCVEGKKPLVCVESAFNAKSLQKWQEKAQEANRKLRLVMVYEREVLEGLERTRKRDYAGIENMPTVKEYMEAGVHKQVIKRDLEFQKQAVTVFDAACALGIHVELYEHVFPKNREEDGLVLVASKEANGDLHIEKEERFAFFRVKAKINPHADIRTRLISTDKGYVFNMSAPYQDLFCDSLTRSEQYLTDQLQSKRVLELG